MDFSFSIGCVRRLVLFQTFSYRVCVCFVETLFEIKAEEMPKVMIMSNLFKHKDVV